MFNLKINNRTHTSAVCSVAEEYLLNIRSLLLYNQLKRG